MSTTRRIRGENRFYNPPPMRKLQQEREKKRLEAEEIEKEKKKAKEILDRKIKVEEKEIKQPEECSTSDCSVPSRVSSTTTTTGTTSSNLGRFLDCTTPIVSTRTCLWRVGEESDGDSPRDMSSDGSNDCRELSQNLYRASLEEKPCIGSSSDESEASSNSPGELVFEYLEGAMPFGREPLTDKVCLLCN
ncbi:hypothetical protein [Arabidopsis thaliana]|uniref:Uncharacterized protein AT4g16100 n=1 Tax=Arabidopsis thaliana TaxID=3702 RepID=O23459_ARATH|nr:hypothetical protein [Arabidopsis thaliana]CAB78652.1 hypothetical protein [Arabidopsis thaliana]